MKLVNSVGPNPRAVRMFVLEKGMELPTEDLDLLAGENCAEPYLKKNPGGQMPALELDDGTIIAETVVICEYLEELQPEPVLIGADALVRSNTRMWLRRVELNITEHMYNGFRYAEGIDIFRNRMVCVPEAADGLKAKAKAAREWLGRIDFGPGLRRRRYLYPRRHRALLLSRLLPRGRSAGGGRSQAPVRVVRPCRRP